MGILGILSNHFSLGSDQFASCFLSTYVVRCRSTIIRGLLGVMKSFGRQSWKTLLKTMIASSSGIEGLGSVPRWFHGTWRARGKSWNGLERNQTDLSGSIRWYSSRGNGTRVRMNKQGKDEGHVDSREPEGQRNREFQLVDPSKWWIAAVLQGIIQHLTSTEGGRTVHVKRLNVKEEWSSGRPGAIWDLVWRPQEHA